MEWYSISALNFQEKDPDAEGRAVSSALNEVREKVFGKGLRGRMKAAFHQYNLWRMAQISIREKQGILNFSYIRHTTGDIGSMDVYAESPEDAVKQMMDKREVVRAFFGVEIPISEDELFVGKCSHPYSEDYTAFLSVYQGERIEALELYPLLPIKKVQMR